MPIPGTTKLHRLEENIAAVDLELDEAERREIDEVPRASRQRASGTHPNYWRWSVGMRRRFDHTPDESGWDELQKSAHPKLNKRQVPESASRRSNDCIWVAADESVLFPI